MVRVVVVVVSVVVVVVVVFLRFNVGCSGHFPFPSLCNVFLGFGLFGVGAGRFCLAVVKVSVSLRRRFGGPLLGAALPGCGGSSTRWMWISRPLVFRPDEARLLRDDGSGGRRRRRHDEDDSEQKILVACKPRNHRGFYRILYSCNRNGPTRGRCASFGLLVKKAARNETVSCCLFVHPRAACRSLLRESSDVLGISCPLLRMRVPELFMFRLSVVPFYNGIHSPVCTVCTALEQWEYCTETVVDEAGTVRLKQVLYD